MRDYKINRVFVDWSNRAVWTTLKNIGEPMHDNDEIYESDIIMPVNLGVAHKKMLSYCNYCFQIR